MTGQSSHRRLLPTYAGLIVAAVAMVGAILWIGEVIVPAGTSPRQTASVHSVGALWRVLLSLAVVIATARLVGVAFRRLQQPPVIGEVVGGILLGPSLLGAVSPAVSAVLLSPETAPLLGVLSQLGIVLYMFMVGLRLDLQVVRTGGTAAVAISHASILCPFVLGVALALTLYPLAGNHASFTSFALFLGVSMSVTAFPVLARILSDNGLHRTDLGMLALTCAAVDDVTAWCLLALVVGVAQAALVGAMITFALTAGYLAVMLLIVKPMLSAGVRRLETQRRLGQGSLAAICVLLLLSAVATEAIGIHAIFGAFVLGAVIPHTSRVATHVTGRLEDMVQVLLVPSFFALTGMRTQIGLLAGWHDWMLCLAIILVAVVGKIGGTFAAARFTGFVPRDALALGILMNTRGLVELIVLNVGLDLGVISPRLFTMLVIMALVTTLMTTPILDRLVGGGWRPLTLPERSAGPVEVAAEGIAVRS